MILKNLMNFIRQNKTLFILITVTQIMSVVIILFSYGVYRNNKYKLAEGESEADYYNFWSKEDISKVKFSDVKTELLKLAEKYDGIIENVMISGWSQIDDINIEERAMVYQYGRIWVGSSFEFSKGGLKTGNRYDEVLKKNDGRYFTDEEINNGAQVCLVADCLYEIEPNCWVIDGIEYEVIGHEHSEENAHNGRWYVGAILPYYSIPDEMRVSYISLSLTRPLLKSEHEELTNDFRMFIPESEVEFPEYTGIDVDEKATMKTMMLAAVFMSLISAFSVCVIYRYILTKRIKTTAIYRICGCTIIKSAMIYISEMVFVLGFSSMFGSILFEFLIEPFLERKYTWFSVIYQNNTCYFLVSLYFTIVAGFSICMIFLSCKATPKEMLRSKVK